MSRLIGLHGRAGAGKDTACVFAVQWAQEHGYTARREGFADRLKLSAARIFFPDIELEEAVSWCNELKEKGSVGGGPRAINEVSMDGRVFLQRYGTEAHRNVFGTDFWVDIALQDLSADFTIVTDVRFPNEAAAIRSRGGVVWKIERPGDDIASNHASEVSLPASSIDGVIWNDGTLEGFRLLIRRMMDCLPTHA